MEKERENIEIIEEKEENQIEYLIDGEKRKIISVIEEPDIEIYKRKRLNLQLIALAMVVIIFIISPLKLLDSRTFVDITAIGFIAASLIPSLIAIFGFMRGRNFCLILTTMIYGVWIVVLATYYLEAVLLIVVLIIYFEVTRMVILIEPIIKEVISIKEGGVYYHASVVIDRYIKFLLKFGGGLFAFSLAISVIGWYLFEVLQGDILFSIFMIIGLITLLVLSQRTLTPDIKRTLIEERRERIERELADSHSRFS